MRFVRRYSIIIVFAAIFMVCLNRFGESANVEPLAPGLWVSTVLATVVIPSHKKFVVASGDMVEAAGRLCAKPGSGTLETARNRFAKLVAAWSNIELYRFGPARVNNLHARLFFWPDRRNRGIRQVKRIIKSEDTTAVDLSKLKNKSVATQGLPALEYLFFGQGAETLKNSVGEYRCSYAYTVAQAIDDHAAILLAYWADDGGHAQTMMSTGGSNSIYYSTEEVIQELLWAAITQLEIIYNLKLKAMLGESPDKTKPYRTPFARSTLAPSAISDNIDSVLRLFANSSAPLLSSKNHGHYAATLRFELDQVSYVFAELDEDLRGWKDLLQIPRTQESLRYSLYPLAGAIRVLREDYTSALGLSLGFNAMDGD